MAQKRLSVELFAVTRVLKVHSTERTSYFFSFGELFSWHTFSLKKIESFEIILQNGY